MGLASLRAFEGLWHEKRGDREMPRRGEFTFEEFKPWLGRMRIVAVGREPLRLTVRLDGILINNTSGVDLTGRDIIAVYEAAGLGELLTPYVEAVASRRPVWDTMRPKGELVNFAEIVRVIVPCGSDGRVDRLLYCAYAFGVTAWTRGIFAHVDRGLPVADGPVGDGPEGDGK